MNQPNRHYVTVTDIIYLNLGDRFYDLFAIQVFLIMKLSRGSYQNEMI